MKHAGSGVCSTSLYHITYIHSIPIFLHLLHTCIPVCTYIPYYSALVRLETRRLEWAQVRGGQWELIQKLYSARNMGLRNHQGGVAQLERASKKGRKGYFTPELRLSDLYNSLSQTRKEKVVLLYAHLCRRNKPKVNISREAPNIVLQNA